MDLFITLSNKIQIILLSGHNINPTYREITHTMLIGLCLDKWFPRSITDRTTLVTQFFPLEIIVNFLSIKPCKAHSGMSMTCPESMGLHYLLPVELLPLIQWLKDITSGGGNEDLLTVSRDADSDSAKFYLYCATLGIEYHSQLICTIHLLAWAKLDPRHKSVTFYSSGCFVYITL